MNRHIKLALMFSAIFPVLFGILALDALFWNKTFYSYMLSSLFKQSLFIFLLILSFIVAPVYLLAGFYSDYIGRVNFKEIIPFIINLACYALGTFVLQFALNDFIIRPYLIIGIHLAVYITGISLITLIKKEKKSKFKNDELQM